MAAERFEREKAEHRAINHVPAEGSPIPAEQRTMDHIKRLLREELTGSLHFRAEVNDETHRDWSHLRLGRTHALGLVIASIMEEIP